VDLSFLDPTRPNAARQLDLHGIAAKIASRDGRPALHLVGSGASAYGERLALLSDSVMVDGTIEATLSGAPLPDAPPGARGFVGVAFHVGAANEGFEAFWLRPTNGRADDQLRRNHAVQYAAYPDHWWDRLRAESPGVYESYVDLVPGALTNVRIEVAPGSARLFVHDTEQPTLVIHERFGPGRGRTGIWIGGGTDAYVTRLRVSPR
jgi:hypothetical protein